MELELSELTVVIATFNERETLPSLVDQLHRALPNANLLIVDDNSPDKTGDWVREQMSSDHRIQLLHRESKEGLGAATIAGLRQALASHSTWIATMDADLSHRVDDLLTMWDAAVNKNGDVIIGSRYMPGGKIENWHWQRRFASRCVNWFARWCLWLRPSDNSGALRIYQSEALNRIELSKIDCRGFVYLEQILVHLQRNGARFYEVPIVFSERELGDSKVTHAELMRNLFDILKMAIKRR